MIDLLDDRGEERIVEPNVDGRERAERAPRRLKDGLDRLLERVRSNRGFD